MDIRDLLDRAEALALAAADVIPGAGLVGNAIEIGEKILDVIDALKEDVTPEMQPEMQEARAKLAESVKAKAAATSARLRG